jgi:hypothetical protein
MRLGPPVFRILLPPDSIVVSCDIGQRCTNKYASITVIFSGKHVVAHRSIDEVINTLRMHARLA